MYLVMLATKQKMWVDAHLARQLQLNDKVLFILREEDDNYRNSSKQNGENGGAL